MESGFNAMEKDVFRTRLLHAKGKRTVRISEVTHISGAVLESHASRGDTVCLCEGVGWCWLRGGGGVHAFVRGVGWR